MRSAELRDLFLDLVLRYRHEASSHTAPACCQLPLLISWSSISWQHDSILLSARGTSVGLIRQPDSTRPPAKLRDCRPSLDFSGALHLLALWLPVRLKPSLSGGRASPFRAQAIQFFNNYPIWWLKAKGFSERRERPSLPSPM